MEADTSRNTILEILQKYSNGYYKFIFNNSPQFAQGILNPILSKIFNISLSSGCNFIKLDNRPLYYYELRILMLVRSSSFDIRQFTQKATLIIEEYDNDKNTEKVDLAILEVLPIFKLYINDPLKIDDLILTHKYVNGIWRNGSKFLHFYTSHDESHSVELILNCIRITKAVDFLSIKKEDYYILFLACYLHDISMVIYPDLDNFSTNNTQTDLIYSTWKTKFQEIKNIETEPKSNIKKIILEYYKEVNDYFENKIRSNHHTLSSKFIKEQLAFNFIEKAIRRIVADVSEAHNYEVHDVYQLKSKAKRDIYDEKYLMIILRLADLLDMSKDRVSVDILRQDIKKMPEVSRYHWISHLAINDCQISSKFPIFNFAILEKEQDEKLKKEKDKLLKPDEIILIEISMNTKFHTKSKSKKCKNVNCRFNRSKSSIEIEITNKDQCDSKDCNFTCQWIMNKHDYLIKELLELKKYLDRNTNNIFNTKIKLLFNFTDSSNLSSEFMDVIRKQIGI